MHRGEKWHFIGDFYPETDFICCHLAHDIIAPAINSFNRLTASSNQYFNGQVQLFHWHHSISGWYNLHRGLISISEPPPCLIWQEYHCRFHKHFCNAMLITGLCLLLGGYFNIYWAHDSFCDTGLSAVLGYRLNEYWEAYLYGQKSWQPTNPLPIVWYAITGDRIALPQHNFNPNFSIQLSRVRLMPRRDGFDKYNYPIPENSNHTDNKVISLHFLIGERPRLYNSVLVIKATSQQCDNLQQKTLQIEFKLYILQVLITELTPKPSPSNWQNTT